MAGDARAVRLRDLEPEGDLLLLLLLGGGRNAGHLHELVVDLVHRAGAVDDLQLTGHLEVALGAHGAVDGLLVHLPVVCDYQPEARRAVGR